MPKGYKKPNKRGRKPFYSFSDGGITKKEFAKIDSLSKRAIKKYNQISDKFRKENPHKEHLIDLEKYNIQFGGADEHWRDFKTAKGIKNYKSSLERFLSPEWENSTFERYKNNFIQAIKNVYGENPTQKRVRDLINEIEDIEDLNELMFIYNYTNGRINISFFYLRAEEDIKKAYVSLLNTLRRGKKRFRGE